MLLHNLLTLISQTISWDYSWGFQDTQFFLNPGGEIELSGQRYNSVFENGRILPKFRDYAHQKIGLRIE